MSKHIIVGAANILLGVLLTAFPLFLIFVTFPRLKGLYASVAATGLSLAGYYPPLGILFVSGVIDLLFGFKLLTGSRESKEKFFGYGVVSAIISLFLPGLVLVAMVPGRYVSIWRSFFIRVSQAK